MARSQDSFTFTVGKLDAGMAILLGERAHLIEFPSILLPPGATAGSIVNIAVHRNLMEEKRRDQEFWALQQEILDTYGQAAPESPKLEVRNVTQTSVTLEWPPIELHTAKLRSLDIYKNGQRLAAIPSPMTNTSTKLSGLDIDHEYTFQLVLRTTAGVFPSRLMSVRTHTMKDTSGISVCFGNVQDSVLVENAKLALREMKAKWSDKIQIDTTHFVCTTPAATPNGAQVTGSIGGAPGVEYQRALQLSIPVVQPHWILACRDEKRMVPIASFYLGASSASPMNSAPFTRPQSMSQVSLPHAAPNATSPTKGASQRASMPPPARQTSTSPPTGSATPAAHPAQSTARAPGLDATLEEHEGDGEEAKPGSPSVSQDAKGQMNKNFKFPPTSPTSETAALPADAALPAPVKDDGLGLTSVAVVTPSSVEVPPPPPVEKEKVVNVGIDDVEEDVGVTEEIDLN